MTFQPLMTFQPFWWVEFPIFDEPFCDLHNISGIKFIWEHATEETKFYMLRVTTYAALVALESYVKSKGYTLVNDSDVDYYARYGAGWLNRFSNRYGDK